MPGGKHSVNLPGRDCGEQQEDEHPFDERALVVALVQDGLRGIAAPRRSG